MSREKSSPNLAVSIFLTASPAIFEISISTEQIIKAAQPRAM
jgi:hypothetical protein